MNRYIPEMSKSTSILGQSGQKHGVLTSILDISDQKQEIYD